MIENLRELKEHINAESVLRLIGYPESNPQSSGNEVRDRCPLHGGDGQRSLCINALTKATKCHSGSCNFEGDIIGLYQKAKNLEFIPAAKELAEHFNFELKFSGATRSEWPKETRTPQQVLADSTKTGTHVYFAKKRVEPCEGLYYGKDVLGKECVIVPLSDVEGNLKTVQFINGQGPKIFLREYPVKGAFFTMGRFDDGDEVYLAEGIATALTIWMAHDKKAPVISFGSINNLAGTVEALLNKYPNLKPIVCLDLDKDNPAMPVQAASKQISKSQALRACSYRMPSFDGLNNPKGLTDFNDLVSVCNQALDVVRKQLQKEVSIDSLLNTQVSNSATTSEASLLLELEYDVLGYMISHSYDDLLGAGFIPEHFENIFSNDISRKVYAAIQQVWQRGLKPSPTEISMQTEYEESRVFDFVNKLSNRQSLGSDQVKHRLEKLRESSAWSVLDSELASLRQGNMSIDEATQRVRKALDSIQAHSEVIPSQASLLDRYVQEVASPKHKPISTGFAQIDRLLGGGFKAGELGLLTGGAGAGKTAFALQLCDQVAQNGGCAVYFSMEIPLLDLTLRSWKRLGYKESNPETLDTAVGKYREFASNVVLIKGYHGMPISQIRGKILSIMRERKQDVVVFIDPFQRLGTGDKRIDLNNETLKVNLLISEIKEMATEMEIPILALSDTVKDHSSNSSGEGSARGSYMADHTADYTMMLRADKDLLTALYGEMEKTKLEKIKQRDPMYTLIEGKAKTPDYALGKYSVTGDNKFYDKYVALVTSKVRNCGKFSPVFIYQPGLHTFKETNLWESILPKEK